MMVVNVRSSEFGHSPADTDTKHDNNKRQCVLAPKWVESKSGGWSFVVLVVYSLQGEVSPPSKGDLLILTENPQKLVLDLIIIFFEQLKFLCLGVFFVKFVWNPRASLSKGVIFIFDSYVLSSLPLSLAGDVGF